MGKHIFCDSVLSMGLKSSVTICQRVINAISFIMFQIGIAILNYLDDLVGAEKKELANFAYLCLGTVLQRCGIKEAPDKTCSPTEVRIFRCIIQYNYNDCRSHKGNLEIERVMVK